MGSPALAGRADLDLPAGQCRGRVQDQGTDVGAQVEDDGTGVRRPQNSFGAVRPRDGVRYVRDPGQDGVE